MYIFNSGDLGFYPLSEMDAYIAAESWPENGVEVDKETKDKFCGEPPAGKMLSADKKGYPCWVDLPEPTMEELAAAAQFQINALLAEAAAAIAPLQDAVDLDMTTDGELEKLNAWKKYRVLLNRIEQQPNFPTQINWPEKPE